GWTGSARQQDAARDRAAAGGDDGDLGRARYLALAGRAPQLEAGLVEDPVAVQATRRELPPVGVERQLAVERDARAPLHEGPALAVRAQAEGLEPGEREEGE